MAAPIIYRDIETPNIRSLAVYREKGGYKALEKALTRRLTCSFIRVKFLDWHCVNLGIIR